MVHIPDPRPLFMLYAALFGAACGSPADAPPAQPSQPAATEPPPGAPLEPPPGAPLEPKRAQPATDDDLKLAASQSEACGQIIVVAFQGAHQAPESITRDRRHALARAGELLAQLKQGADFAELARKESDAPNSAARGGTMGTYAKADWPALHAPLKEPLFALAVGEIAPAAIETDYGIALLRRCPVEKARSRHILVRYKGAKKADGDIKRTKDQAKAFAEACAARLAAGEEFAAVARECSDDASKDRGGDIGLVGRGLLAPPYEAALFALAPGARSPIVETDFGFHVIERLPD